MMNRHPLPTFDWREVKAKAQAWAAEVGGPPMVPAANYLLRIFSIEKAPVPVGLMANCLGVQVYRAPNFGELQGALYYPNGEPTIYVNATHSAVKQRFTIAHELGHLVLHEEGQKFRELSYVGPFSKKVEERQANTFAAHLLMPLSILEPYIASRRVSEVDAARFFQVSERALRWQLEHFR